MNFLMLNASISAKIPLGYPSPSLPLPPVRGMVSSWGARLWVL